MATNIGEQFTTLRHQMSDQERMIKNGRKKRWVIGKIV